MAPKTRLEPATEGSLQISGRIRNLLCRRRLLFELTHFTSAHQFPFNGKDRMICQTMGAWSWFHLSERAAIRSGLPVCLFGCYLGQRV
ncbi:hypothetical protein PoB_002240000 [Plakobranchus ocellatus]|uniref:Uncharacterized protein n=1 Tax=Plakobranchus ocellatus TaxID=259542 RepID=A0AAV3ZL93_9GAST|nr:hypothetical protein PoB_002240000 [Plakobranchus ocellatus]